MLIFFSFPSRTSPISMRLLIQTHRQTQTKMQKSRKRPKSNLLINWMMRQSLKRRHLKQKSRQSQPLFRQKSLQSRRQNLWMTAG